jgi:arylsulfatase A-like enzyme
MPGPRSLILITVDCLRADHVGFLGYCRPTTPFLDCLAQESAVFSNAIVAGTPTYYSFPAIMASRYPLALGRDVVGLAPDEPTLASVLSQMGYATAAFVAGNPYLSRRFGYHAGFDTFVDFFDADPAALLEAGDDGVQGNRFNRKLADFCHKLGLARSVYDELYFQYCQRLATPPATSLETLRRFPSADAVVDQASAWLHNATRPFFLWLHLMDPHSPYYPSEQALKLMEHEVDADRARYLNSYWNRSGLRPNKLQRHRDEVIALYDAGIRWVDAQVERLAGVLRSAGLWNSCVLALTADHGEEFLDHGGRYHAPRKLTEELIRVPLMLRYPGHHGTELVEEPFSLIRLAPTLLEAVNAPVPGSFRGRSWRQPGDDNRGENEAIVECVTGCTNPFRVESRVGARILVVREARYKLVLDFSSVGEQLFDLKNDAQELAPLPHDTEQPVRLRLLKRARQHLRQSLQSRDVDACLSARLREIQLDSAHSANQVAA